MPITGHDEHGEMTWRCDACGRDFAIFWDEASESEDGHPAAMIDERTYCDDCYAKWFHPDGYEPGDPLPPDFAG